jgi:hypothetical protein
LVVATIGGGCAAGGGLAEPTARVVGVVLASQTHEGARLETVIELENPNRTPVPLVEAEYTVSLQGVGSYTAREWLHRTIPAAAGPGDGGSPGRQVVRLPVAIANTGWGDLAGAAYEVEGSVSYRPAGEIRQLLTEMRVPLPSVGFEGSGRVERGD